VQARAIKGIARHCGKVLGEPAGVGRRLSDEFPDIAGFIVTRGMER
jgi:hypothetical protein